MHTRGDVGDSTCHRYNVDRLHTRDKLLEPESVGVRTSYIVV